MTAKGRGGCDVGFVGLGRIGGNLCRHSLAEGFSVAGFDLGSIPEDMISSGLRPAESLADLVQQVASPRKIFVYVPAGPSVDAVLLDLVPQLEPGDVVVDGGNSYWRDSISRHAQLEQRGIFFVDLGTSGGLMGARQGGCFMAGGDVEAVAAVAPFLESIAAEGGFLHVGPSGAGHLVKVIHNGIEFVMLEGIAEGVALLEEFFEHNTQRIAEVLEMWRHGSVIRSWLIDLVAEAYEPTKGLSEIPPYVEDTGEVNWLVTDALEQGVAIPAISHAANALIASRDERRVADRAISAMRHGFGGHPLGPDANVARGRRAGRLRGAMHR